MFLTINAFLAALRFSQWGIAKELVNPDLHDEIQNDLITKKEWVRLDSRESGPVYKATKIYFDYLEQVRK